MSMKLLAFSDLHDEEAALESLSRIAPAYDRVLACGDISHSASFAKSMLELMPNALVVPGNWDSHQVNDALMESPQWAHCRRFEVEDGLNIVGFGYSPPTPFGTFGEMQEEEIYRKMSGLPIDSDTLLMLHCPPKGHFDLVHLVRRIGSASILRIIEEKRPLAALFGHVHEHAGTSRLGRTELIKLPPANMMRAASVTVKDKRIATEFISL